MKRQPRMPRVPVNQIREERVTVVLSADEKLRLDGAAQSQGISRSDVLRRAIREYPLPSARGDSPVGTRREA